jgi:hypothetical protein
MRIFLFRLHDRIGHLVLDSGLGLSAVVAL